VKKSSEHMQRVILTRLYKHLRASYAISLMDELPFRDHVSLQRIDAMLAFKSDPQLDELRAALARIEEGTFGICLGCKEEIRGELMDMDPTRRLCDDCTREYSHVGRAYHGTALPV
jgi:RNA polymerase-binding transcription factor DksA